MGFHVVQTNSNQPRGKTQLVLSHLSPAQPWLRVAVTTTVVTSHDEAGQPVNLAEKQPRSLPLMICLYFCTATPKVDFLGKEKS